MLILSEHGNPSNECSVNHPSKHKQNMMVDGDLVKIAEHKYLVTAERLSKLQGQRNFWIGWMI